ncbi:MAG: hypothetical protein U0Z17_09770 [Bacteroidales bacterium]
MYARTYGLKDFVQMPATGKHPNCISMAWSPERACNHGWSRYNEDHFIYVLAAEPE